MIKDLSHVKAQKPVLGKLAMMRQLQKKTSQLDIGLAAFSERIAQRVLRRDLRSWRRFTLEYRMEEEAAQSAVPSVENHQLALDVLFQIYAGAQQQAAPAAAALSEVERLVERRLLRLQPEWIAARYELRMPVRNSGRATLPNAVSPAATNAAAPFSQQPAFRELMQIERERMREEKASVRTEHRSQERMSAFEHTVQRLVKEVQTQRLSRMHREQQIDRLREIQPGRASYVDRERVRLEERSESARSARVEPQRPAARSPHVPVPASSFTSTSLHSMVQPRLQPALQVVLERQTAWQKRREQPSTHSNGLAAWIPASRDRLKEGSIPDAGNIHKTENTEKVAGLSRIAAAGSFVNRTQAGSGRVGQMLLARALQPQSIGRREMRIGLRTEKTPTPSASQSAVQQEARRKIESIRDFGRTQLVYVQASPAQESEAGVPLENPKSAPQSAIRYFTQRRLAQSAATSLARAVQRMAFAQAARLERKDQAAPEGADISANALPPTEREITRVQRERTIHRERERTLERRVLERALFLRERAEHSAGAAELVHTPQESREALASSVAGAVQKPVGLRPMAGWLLRETQPGRPDAQTPGTGKLTEHEVMRQRIESVRRYGLTQLELRAEREGQAALESTGAPANALLPTEREITRVQREHTIHRERERTLERRVLERALFLRERAERSAGAVAPVHMPQESGETTASSVAGAAQKPIMGLRPMAGWLLREAQPGLPGVQMPSTGSQTTSETVRQRIESVRRYGLTQLELRTEREGQTAPEGADVSANALPPTEREMMRVQRERTIQREHERTLERRVLERALFLRERAERSAGAVEPVHTPQESGEAPASSVAGTAQKPVGLRPMAGWLLRETQPGRPDAQTPGTGKLTEHEVMRQHIESVRRYGLTQLELRTEREGQAAPEGADISANALPPTEREITRVQRERTIHREHERTLERRVLERALFLRERAERGAGTVAPVRTPQESREAPASSVAGTAQKPVGLRPMAGWLLREAQPRLPGTQMPGIGKLTAREVMRQRIESVRRYGLTQLELRTEREGQAASEGTVAPANALLPTERETTQNQRERTIQREHERTLERRVLERALFLRERAEHSAGAAAPAHMPQESKETPVGNIAGAAQKPIMGLRPMAGWLLREAQPGLPGVQMPGTGSLTEREVMRQRIESVRRYGLTQLELRVEREGQSTPMGAESAADNLPRRRALEDVATRAESLATGATQRYLRIYGSLSHAQAQPARGTAHAPGMQQRRMEIWRMQRGRDGAGLIHAGASKADAPRENAGTGAGRLPVPARIAAPSAARTRVREVLLRSIQAAEKRAERLRQPTAASLSRAMSRPVHKPLPPLRTAVEGQAGMTQILRTRRETVQRSVLETIALAGEAESPLRSSILTTPAEIVMFVPPTYMNAYGAPPARVGNLSWDEQPSATPSRNSASAALDLMRKAQQKFGQPARYRPPEMVMKEQNSPTGRLASQQNGQPRSINQEIQARKKAVERVQAQELSSAEITRIVDRVYDKLERKIATEYRRRGL